MFGSAKGSCRIESGFLGNDGQGNGAPEVDVGGEAGEQASATAISPLVSIVAHLGALGCVELREDLLLSA